MGNLSGSELFFYGGILIMILSAAAGLICTTVFSVTGRRLKEQLEKEYGKPEI